MKSLLFLFAVFITFTCVTAITECQVAAILREVGFPASVIPKMVCTAKYESAFNCGATNTNTNGSYDYGLFQINDYWWCSGSAKSRYNGCGVSCSSLFDCKANARCALKVYNQQGLDAWYGYKNHKATCDSYKLPSC